MMAREAELDRVRQAMVDRQILHRGVKDPRILNAMSRIPRHKFVPYTKPKSAYVDTPLPIGQGQTISQPYITAYMTELLDVHSRHRVLEVGTGSGYQAALLAELCREVYTIEIVIAHYRRSRKILEQLGYSNVRQRLGNGREGWPEAAPFDRILVTAAGEQVPNVLLKQLKEGGKLVIPVGETLMDQRLLIYTRRKNRFLETRDLAVRFVPLVAS